MRQKNSEIHPLRSFCKRILIVLERQWRTAQPLEMLPCALLLPLHVSRNTSKLHPRSAAGLTVRS